MTTTALTGFTLNLRRSGYASAGVGAWGTKTDALAALSKMRETGHNCDRHIEVHRAETYLSRFWAIGRPDHFNGITYLMTGDGRWVPGRLFDTGPCCCPSRCEGHPAPWVILDARQVEPATFEHVTRTVPDRHNQHERYKTKSNGSCGRWITTDDSIAICTCGERWYRSTRGEAQAAARAHRQEECSTPGAATSGSGSSPTRPDTGRHPGGHPVMDTFDTDPWRSEIGAALLNAVDSTALDEIYCAPDGVWMAKRAEDAYIMFGDDGADGYDSTTYGPTGAPGGTDNWAEANMLARHVEAFLRGAS